jgi:zinc/manganese transport system substrate-binding protein
MRVWLRPLARVAMTRVAMTGVAMAGIAANLGACGSPAVPSTGSAGKLAVVAATPIVADLTRNVGGDKVEVTQILKPNVDAHDYEPTAADVATIGKAKVLVKNGVGLEKWLDEAIKSAGFTGTVVDSSTGVQIRKVEGEEDPHIWHNPRNVKIMAQNIQKALATADAPNASTYQANYDAYAAKLDKLDAGIEAQINSVPVAQRKLVTNHDAFGYYVDRYKLEFIGSIIPSIDTSAEMSAKDRDDLVAKIKATGTKAVFSESSLPPKIAEAIAKQAGVQVVAGEDALYGDSLGPGGSAGDTYLKMEQHNTDTIVKALRG